MPDDLSCFVCSMPIYEESEYKKLKRDIRVCNHCIEAGKLSPELEADYKEIWK